MSYNPPETRNNEHAQPLSTGEERAVYRRRPANPIAASGGRFELLPATTTVYETPWDQQTPDANTLSFNTLSPATPRYEGAFDSVDRPLLAGHKHGPSTPDASDPRKTHFNASITSQQTYNDTDVFQEFGPVPSSANANTEFHQVNPPAYGRNRSSWVSAKHPWSPDTFEPIHWPPLIFLTIVVVVTYPLLYLAALAAQERSIFWTRFIVGSVGSVLGFVLGLGMMEIGKRLLEAATWATFIHRSMDGRGGVTLGDLDTKSTYPNFTWLGLNLFIERNFSRIFWRRHRPYDKTPWSLYCLFFIFISMLAASISFLLGRLIDITTSTRYQWNAYHEVAVIGDLSPQDIESSKVQLEATEAFVQTWTVSPFGAGGQVPVPVRLEYQGTDVYFAEISNHLLPDGLGLGTFQQDRSTQSDGYSDPSLSIIPSNTTRISEPPVGAVVRYSRWGLKIQCAKLPNARQYIVPLSPSNMTYAYVPRDTILSLMSAVGLRDAPFSWDRSFLHEEDQVPDYIDMETIGAVGVWYNNGVAQSFYSYTFDGGDAGGGWGVLEMVMMRMNTTYTPNGSFPAFSQDQQIGYDAAVCVERVEPFVVDAYNSTTGKAQTFKVIGKGGLSTLDYNYGKRVGSKAEGLDSSLTSTGKFAAYAVGHDNSRNQILKDNARDFPWIPNPTAISWTDGFGPKNYTSLSAERLQASLGRADAAQFLPYLTGSQHLVAYKYTDDSIAFASVLPIPTVATLAVVLLLGFISAFCVPRLPLGVPRRDFGLFTWIAAFEGDGILHSAINHQSLDRNMDLEELQRKYGEQKVRYVS